MQQPKEVLSTRRETRRPQVLIIPLDNRAPHSVEELADVVGPGFWVLEVAHVGGFGDDDEVAGGEGFVEAVGELEGNIWLVDLTHRV